MIAGRAQPESPDHHNDTQEPRGPNRAAHPERNNVERTAPNHAAVSDFVIPISTPFPDIASYVFQSKGSRTTSRKQPNRRGSTKTSFRTVTNANLPFISPWILQAIWSAGCCLPLLFCRQPATGPFAKCFCLIKTHANHREIETVPSALSPKHGVFNFIFFLRHTNPSFDHQSFSSL